MAKQSQVTRADRKAELISELAWSRAELARNLHDARNDLDLMALHVESSRRNAERTGILLAILGALFNLFRPLLTALATRKINEMAARSGGWRNPLR